MDMMGNICMGFFIVYAVAILILVSLISIICCIRRKQARVRNKFNSGQQRKQSNFSFLEGIENTKDS